MLRASLELHKSYQIVATITAGVCANDFEKIALTFNPVQDSLTVTAIPTDKIVRRYFPDW